MGNCQAVDAAALVIQHPNGKIERMYWPISVCEVMKLNPGYYVSLIIPLPTTTATTTTTTTADHDVAHGASTVDKPKSSASEQPGSSAAHRHHQDQGQKLVVYQNKSSTIRFTRVKLLRPTDTLVLGRAYRLVTSQEVMKVLRAKKHAKMKKNMNILDCQDSSVHSSTKLHVSPPNSSSETITTAHGVRDRKPRLHLHDSDIIRNQAARERQRPRTASSSAPVWNRSSKSWRPSLQTISEASS